jgi:hypothetical protein
MPGMKGGIHFSDRYLRVRLRSSGKARIGLREYLGGKLSKGHVRNLAPGNENNTLFPEPDGNFALFI